MRKGAQILRCYCIDPEQDYLSPSKPGYFVSYQPKATWQSGLARDHLIFNNVLLEQGKLVENT